MKPSNSKIPTLQVPAAAEKASPLPPPKAKSEIFKLTRNLTAICIPDGRIEQLTEGTEAYLTQALGSSFTIAVNHQLFRIDGEDGDAIHQQPRPMIDAKLLADPVNEATVKAILKTCYDPEIPVNLLDLGLIYKVSVTDKNVHIQMTLTNPGCGMGEVMVQDIRRKLLKLKQVGNIDIQLVFTPPWSRDMISTAGQLALGLL